MWLSESQTGLWHGICFCIPSWVWVWVPSCIPNSWFWAHEFGYDFHLAFQIPDFRPMGLGMSSISHSKFPILGPWVWVWVPSCIPNSWFSAHEFLYEFYLAFQIPGFRPMSFCMSSILHSKFLIFGPWVWVCLPFCILKIQRKQTAWWNPWWNPCPKSDPQKMQKNDTKTQKKRQNKCKDKCPQKKQAWNPGNLNLVFFLHFFWHFGIIFFCIFWGHILGRSSTMNSTMNSCMTWIGVSTRFYLHPQFRF